MSIMRLLFIKNCKDVFNVQETWYSPNMLPILVPYYNLTPNPECTSIRKVWTLSADLGLSPEDLTNNPASCLEKTTWQIVAGPYSQIALRMGHRRMPRGWSTTHILQWLCVDVCSDKISSLNCHHPLFSF